MINVHKRRWFLIRGVDIIVVTLAFVLAYWFRLNWRVLASEHANLSLNLVKEGQAHQFVALLFTLDVVVLIGLDRTEKKEHMRTISPAEEALVVVRALTWSHVLLLALSGLYYREAFSRATLLGLYPLSILMLGTWRLVLKSALARARCSGLDVRRMLIAGAGDTGRRVLTEIQHHPEYGLRIMGFMDDNADGLKDGVDGMPVLGTLSHCAATASEHGVEDVLIAIPNISRRILLQVIRSCEQHNLHVQVVPSPADLVTCSGSILQFGDIPVLMALGEPLGGLGRVAKRVLDVAVGAAGLIVLAPVMLLIALAIALDTPGPVIYRQRRVGRYGRQFSIYKFRSMVISADDQRASIEHLNESLGGVTFKLRSDPRITRVGRWLRRFSLDELPQLFNVLDGDMSLVGPRPPLVHEVQQYSSWMKKRLETQPGLTGLWQVSGRSEIGFEQMVELDLFYIEHWSFWLDLKLLIQTIPTVISGRGAY